MSERMSRFAKGWPAVFVVGIVLGVVATIDAPDPAVESEPGRGWSWAVPVAGVVVLAVLAVAGFLAWWRWWR